MKNAHTKHSEGLRCCSNESQKQQFGMLNRLQSFYCPFLCCPTNAFLLHLSPKQFWIVLFYLLPQILHELNSLHLIYLRKRERSENDVLQRTGVMSGGLGSILGFTPPKSLPQSFQINKWISVGIELGAPQALPQSPICAFCDAYLGLYNTLKNNLSQVSKEPLQCVGQYTTAQHMHEFCNP